MTFVQVKIIIDQFLDQRFYLAPAGAPKLGMVTTCLPKARDGHYVSVLPKPTGPDYNTEPVDSETIGETITPSR